MENNNQPTLGNGKICYLEIPAFDAALSSSFYEKTFGWKVRTRGDGHLAFDDTVGQVSGAWITGRKPATEPGLMVYIWVDDIEKTIEAVIANGCKIVQPMGMDPGEKTARFADPAGNVLGIYQEPG